jgi:hypothetical protein
MLKGQPSPLRWVKALLPHSHMHENFTRVCHSIFLHKIYAQMEKHFESEPTRCSTMGFDDLARAQPQYIQLLLFHHLNLEGWLSDQQGGALDFTFYCSLSQ